MFIAGVQEKDIGGAGFKHILQVYSTKSSSAPFPWDQTQTHTQHTLHKIAILAYPYHAQNAPGMKYALKCFSCRTAASQTNTEQVTFARTTERHTMRKTSPCLQIRIDHNHITRQPKPQTGPH